MSPTIRIYLFAGHELMLETLRAALADTGGLRCVGTAGSLAQALGDLARLEVDVAVVEASDAGRSLDQVRELAEADPELKILAVGLAGARQAVSFLEAGASGYLLKNQPWSEVREAARGILAGRTPCSPRVAAMVYRRIAELSRAEELSREEEFHRAAELNRTRIPRAELARRRHPEELAEGEAQKLSRRESQVLRLLALGLRNKEIARHLGIAMSTAANHVQKILNKLGAHRRRDAVRHACRLGLVQLPALGSARA